MTDPRVSGLADVIVSYSTAVQPGDRVLIQGSSVSAPLIKEIYAKTLMAGGHPFVMTGLAGLDEIYLRHASKEQLEYIPEPLMLALETFEVGITVLGSPNTRSLTNVDPAKLQMMNKAQTHVLQKTIQRMANGSYRWLATSFPNYASAQDAEMGLLEYEELTFNACLPEPNDPVGYWKRFSAWQSKLVDWLRGKKSVRVLGPETDLRLSIEGRTFINCDGRQNMPDGEVCTSPVEDSMEGTVYFSYPAVYQSREVTGVRLTLEKGKVVKATATKGQDFLTQTLDTDEGARRVGEFAIGTNKGITRFTRSILFDEKINGSFHIALGHSLPDAGGVNESAIHWDMICDLRNGGEIWVDDTLLYKGGQFVIEF